MPTTIYDVAKRAGVSTYTVSAVLNRSARVSPELTTRVEVAVRELNYTPNAVARSLQTRVTKSIGMAIPDISNPFYASFVRGLESRLRQDGYSVLLTSSGEDEGEQNKQIGNFKARQVDGLVVVMVSGSEESLQSLMAERRPVVFSARVPVTFEADCVSADNVLGSRMAVEHLIRSGHRRVALVTGDLGVSTGSDRALGWRQAMESNGLEASADLLAVGDWTAATGHRLTHQLMSQPNPPTALFGANFLILTGMLRALRERGLRVPHDVQLASSDDSEWLDAFDPPVTTIAQPTFAIGYESASLLLKRIQNPARPYERVTLPPELKVRG
jgi:LacI family transcriptional regulator